MSTNDRIYSVTPWLVTAFCLLFTLSACSLPGTSGIEVVGDAFGLPDSDVPDRSVMTQPDSTNGSVPEDMNLAQADVSPRIDDATVAQDAALVEQDAVVQQDAAIISMSCRQSDGDGDGFGTDESCDRIDCDDGNASIHPDSSEACNGVDDDCDLAVDEEMPMVTCGRGSCQRTRESCVNGAVEPCLPGAPQVELCNGADDDCDGTTDEEVELETCGVGLCQNTESCVGGVLQACQPLEGTAERCDGIDNDCDGTVDEGYGAELQQVTYAELSTIIDGCSGDGWAGVANADCDAAMHRYCVNQGCFRSGFGPGEHSNGNAILTCVTNVVTIETDFPTLATFHGVCASDGERRGPQCNAAISRFCRAEGYVSGYGPIENLNDEVMVACVGAPAHHHGTTYSVLTTFHGPCDGVRDRYGPNCNAAIKRYCVSIGYASGFGPNENSGDNAVVTCLP